MRTLRHGAIALALACVALVATGCKKPAGSQAAHEAAANVRPDEASRGPAVPFDVRAERTDLTFFWFDEHGTPHPANRIDDIPAERRQMVRVDPPSPEMRSPGWVYIADVRTPGPDGRFPTRSVASEELASALASANGLAQAMAPTMPSAPNPPPGSPAARVFAPSATGQGSNAHGPSIVIYGASWCSACHQAAAWLRAQNIPFVEHDIETEPAAAQEMMARAREQGVPTGSIPIIAINGRLMVGFNPNAIQAAMQGS